jgi:chemotaxis receptor (MCP) glutamine deamidase CheD
MGRLASLDGRLRHTLPMGGVFASREPAVIKTVLGSCIAVCLLDPRQRIGGMNHFMLPSRLDPDGDHLSACYGVYAMDLLVNEMMKLGAERGRLRAKVFGAAHLLGMREGAQSVATQNAAFITSYLETEGIPLASQDLGGDRPRTIYFFTDTGRVLLKRLGRGALGQLAVRERQYERKVVLTLETPADVTLF